MIKEEASKIFIIDDEESVRNGLSLLLKSANYDSEAFASVAEFLARDEYLFPSCILLDVYMEGESGLELLESVARKYYCSPVIYITGFGDIPMSVSALKKGALNFLQKPIDDELLIDAINEALKISRNKLDSHNEITKLKTRIDSLTPREFEIFKLVIKGLLNKQIAYELNIAEHTVKLHRGKVTEKLGVKNVADLIHIAERLQLNH